MELLYLIVGLIVCAGFGLFLCGASITWIVGRIKEAGENRLERWLIGQMNDVSRWCGYEFPQIEFYNERLKEAIANGWRSMETNQFRESLRSGEYLSVLPPEAQEKHVPHEPKARAV